VKWKVATPFHFSAILAVGVHLNVSASPGMDIAFLLGRNTPVTRKLEVMLRGVKALMNADANNSEN